MFSARDTVKMKRQRKDENANLKKNMSGKYEQ